MKNFQNDWSRRKFITSITGAGSAILFSPFPSWAAYEIDPKIAAIVAKTIGIDTHNHIDVPSKMEELPEIKIDLLGEMNIRRTRFQGRSIIEVCPTSYEQICELREIGLINIIQNSRNRFFLPETEKKAKETLSKVLRLPIPASSAKKRRK